MKNNTYRSFGAFEKAFWLINQMAIKDFAIIAELEGNASTEAWQSALHQVRLHHSNLALRVNTNVTSHLILEPTDAPVSLKVIEGNEQLSWQETVEQERKVAFDIEGPTVRAVVLQKQGTSTLILLAHHSLFDGMSLTYLIRDILTALNNKFAPAPYASKSLDEVLGFSTDHPQQSPDILVTERMSPVQGHIDSFKLPVALTAKLIERSKAEQTSVHGALAAAVFLAGRKIFNDWKDKTVKLASPVNMRKALNLGDVCGMFITTEASEHHPEQGSSFWDIARQVKGGFATDQKAHATSFIEQIQQILFHIPDSQQILEILKKAFNHQVMISNLGQLPYQSDFGKLKIKDFWGPIVLSGIGQTPTIGAVTVNGSLHLTNISELSVPRLFETMTEVIEEACIS